MQDSRVARPFRSRQTTHHRRRRRCGLDAGGQCPRARHLPEVRVAPYCGPVVVHTFHLAKPGLVTTVATLVRPPTSATVAGLHHAECMMPMRLGDLTGEVADPSPRDVCRVGG